MPYKLNDHLTHLPANLASLIGLKRLLTRLEELILLLDNSQPEGSQSIVVVAASMTVTLDDGIGTELLQTGAG